MIQYKSKYTEQDIPEILAEIEREDARIRDLLTRGLGAVGEVDQKFGYGVETNLTIARNHIIYWKQVINSIPISQQLKLF